MREYWPEFQAELASQGKFLPAYISIPLPLRLLLARNPKVITRVLGIV